MTGQAAKAQVVIHADDVGMNHGTNAAFAELSRLGACSAGSVMVPCPWFLEMAEMAAADPSLDLGVHLTLTAEHRYYKWRPVSAPPPSAGLTDAQGYLWPDVASLMRHASLEAIEAELRAQIDAAFDMGVDVTHLDDHMGAVLVPEVLDIYIRIGLDYALPILLTPSLSLYGPIHNIPDVEDAPYRERVETARAAGFPIFDRVVETPWDRAGPAEPVYREMFSVQGDLLFYALHFNAPGEIEAISPESCRFRTDEYALFHDPGFRDWLAERPFEVIGMRAMRDGLRAAWGQERRAVQ